MLIKGGCLDLHEDLKCENIVLSIMEFERLLNEFNGNFPDTIWPLISTIIGNNYYKRCCSNCQHSLQCKIKDVAIHDMSIRADEFACNLFMINR